MSTHVKKPKAIAIVGPTASGKTALSIKIAKRFSGEVVSADSRQVYRGMDIGTGKVTEAEMAGIPHHLIDIVDTLTAYTAADFKRDASAAILDIHNHHHLPIIVGGTFFYLDVLRGHSPSAPVPPNEAFRMDLESFSTIELFQKLSILDPDRAATIDPKNRHRLVRSLEIVDALGKVPPATTSESDYEWLVLGVEISKEQLHKNIHDRLMQRIEAGMIDEAIHLHKNGVTYERMDQLGLEYRYLAKYLHQELSKEEMIDTLETKIKQYAKRQMTWLKRDTAIEWFEPGNCEVMFKRIEEFLSD